MEAHALRVSSGEKVLAYSGDSGPSDELALVAADADLFVCEATLLSGDLDGQPRGHLSIDEALAAYTSSGAQRAPAHASAVPSSRRPTGSSSHTTASSS